MQSILFVETEGATPSFTQRVSVTISGKPLCIHVNVNVQFDNFFEDAQM
jgi:hypothetical protein